MFDSKLLYLIQTLVIAGSLFLLVRKEARLLQIQIIIWTVGVIAIMWRYEPVGQLGFYSNDQIQYAAVVRILTTWTWAEGEASSLFWWTEFSKIPFPAAAAPLALVGIHFALALKTVSLICLLALSRELLARYQVQSVRSQFTVLYLTGCGLIGTFFSLVALRETMMMFFVYRYATDRRITIKIVSIAILFLLRSHLAAALIAAEIVLAVWIWITRGRRIGYAEVPALIVGGVTLGYLMFSWRFNGIQGYDFFRRLQTPFSGNFGITETLQTASNFAGLQFLTASEAFVRLSVTELLLLRLVFSDTILIPVAFTIVCLVVNHQLSERHRFALLAFTIYISIVTNTDFNSFRQNIPLMPLMGVVILDYLNKRRVQRLKELSPASSEADSTSAYNATRNVRL
jgi:hypothetical protein